MTDPTADLPSWRLPNGGRVDTPSDVGRDPVAAMTWEEHQDWENAWWGDCVNTFGEEAKQLTYADRMGLVNTPRDGQWPVYDLGSRAIMDIGGGPSSILLKCVPPVPGFEGPTRRVIDPCPYPAWVDARYDAAGIQLVRMKGEDIKQSVGSGSWDEVWIYNVLQHVEDPVAILRHAARIGKVVRLFEWIDTPPAPGHPNTITAEMVRAELGPGGTIEDFSGSTENGCSGLAIFGVFEQDHQPPSDPGLDAAIQKLRDIYGAGAVQDAVILR